MPPKTRAQELAATAAPETPLGDNLDDNDPEVPPISPTPSVHTQEDDHAPTEAAGYTPADDEGR